VQPGTRVVSIQITISKITNSPYWSSKKAYVKAKGHPVIQTHSEESSLPLY
jgi:hypothetical protein